MPSPFPGMDPYLEHPALWPDVHTSLIVALRDDLSPRLQPRYYVAVEERVYLATYDDPPAIRRPDVTIAMERPESTTATMQKVKVPLPVEEHERYLEVRRVDDHEVVTVIEILSPGNKRPGEGYTLYKQKRDRILASRTNLVEIDLLRAHGPMPMAPQPTGSHYRILVSRSLERPHADLYVFSVRQPIPEFPVPLAPGDPEPVVRLGELLAGVYDRAGYHRRIDYRRPPVPPLDADDARWAVDLLTRQGYLRTAGT